MHRTVEGVDQTWYTKVGARSAHPSCSLADRLEMHAQGFAEHLIPVAPDLVPDSEGVEGHPFLSGGHVLDIRNLGCVWFPVSFLPDSVCSQRGIKTS